MKKQSLIFISIIFLFKSFSAHSYSSDPKMFIEELVVESINKLANKNIGKDEKFNFIKKIAIENVDINALGLYTLGELRKITDQNMIANKTEV